MYIIYVKYQDIIINKFKEVIFMPTECENCGWSLSGGEYVAQWEDDDNAEGYIICPHCKHKNYDYSDDD